MSYQNLEIWSQGGTVGLDLNQRPLTRKREKVTAPQTSSRSRIFPFFRMHDGLQPVISPTVIGFLK